MSDPRWRKDLTRSNWHKPPTQLDSPVRYGWRPIDVNDEGYTVFALGTALMRATMPRDGIKYSWIVFLNDKVLANYDLAVLTEDVRKAIYEIPFSGEPYPQQDGSLIGEAGL